MNYRNSIFQTVFYFLTAWVISTGTAAGEENLSRISLANSYYAKGQYQEAAAGYQKLINGGYKNGFLYYNLGNSYYRLGKTGPAILNYIRAKHFLPRDESLKANLKTAILKTEDQLEPPSAKGIGTFLFWVNDFTLKEQLKFLGIINLFFWGVLSIWIIQKAGFWNVARKTMTVILLIAIISIGAKVYLESENTLGVVLAKNTQIKSARGANNVTLFQLHEGSVVSIIESQNDWYYIELNDGKKGWAQKEFVGSEGAY